MWPNKLNNVRIADVRNRWKRSEASRILYHILWHADHDESHSFDREQCGQSASHGACEKSGHTGRLSDTAESHTAGSQGAVSTQAEGLHANVQSLFYQRAAHTRWERQGVSLFLLIKTLIFIYIYILLLFDLN